jgi:tetratricopeptide (TPR) repeat protein
MAEYRAGVLAVAPRPEKPLEDWVATHPGDADVVAALADTRQAKGDTDGAIKLYERALETLPSNPVLLNNLAVLYQAKGNPKALELAERAYNVAPRSAAIQDTYGWLLLEHGQVDKAVQMLGDAFKGLPGNAEVLYHYAAALAKSGKADEAVPLLEEALDGQLPPAAKADAQKLLKQISK